MDFRWQDVRLIYLREVRAALRERSVVLNSILIPLLLYPVILWLGFQVLTFAQGQEDRFVSRVAWQGEARPVPLAEEMGGEEKVVWLESRGEDADRQAILAEELDLSVVAEPDAAFPGNLRLRLLYDASKERSAKARERLREAAAQYRGLVLEDEAKKNALPPSAWKQVYLQQENVSSDLQMGAFLLGLLAPMLMVIMIAVGTLYPAIDSLAGERERSTWETTFTTAASRESILLAKFLYVTTFSLSAGLINLAAMVLSMPMIVAPMLGGDEKLAFAIPWTSAPLIVLAAALLAMAISGGMMLLAAFARTFKEGQSMVGPVYTVAIITPMLVNSPDLRLTFGWALVPVANVILLFREAIAGVFNWPMIGLTLLIQVALVALCLYLARQVLRLEEVLTGTYGGNFQRFLKERLARRGSGARPAKEPGA